ncbi:rod shape-determining protein MreD [Clostridiaceae bacterium]|jgi:rod shape-determining protein MreD|nr:rod shape-determining protein MreD [Clostridium sp.]NBI72260.1 rod shape-determining protein MreD [Clostridiaceae bacterium]
MRKILINIGLMVLAFTIQICVFPQIAFLSAAPNLLLTLTFICAFIEGKEMGMLYGFVAGLLMDLFYSGPFGFYTLFFVNMGYINGICTKYYYEDYITLPLVLSIVNDLAYNLYIYIFRFLIRNRLNFGHYFLKIILPEMIFTTVTTLVCYSFLLFIHRKLREWEQRRDSNLV